jgi:DNA-binding response OmpR family regulator
LASRGPIRIGELLIDHSLHQVTLDGNLLQLTPTEYRLLTVLAARPDQVVPRDALAKLVWGDPDTGTSRTIDVHIGRLRVKLSQSGRLAPQIISVRGFGYKIVSSVRGTGGDSLRANSEGPARSMADGLIG